MITGIPKVMHGTAYNVFRNELTKLGFSCTYVDGASSITAIRRCLNADSAVIRMNESEPGHRYARLGELYGKEVIYDYLFNKIEMTDRVLYLHENADDLVVIGDIDGTRFVCVTFKDNNNLVACGKAVCKKSAALTTLISEIIGTAASLSYTKISCETCGEDYNNMIKVVTA